MKEAPKVEATAEEVPTPAAGDAAAVTAEETAKDAKPVS